MSSKWNPDFALHVAQTFCRQAGLHDRVLKLVRHYRNAIFHIPSDGLTLRVYGPDAPLERARRMVSFARLLESRGFPSVRLSDRFADQPMEILGTQVSVWKWVNETKVGGKDFRSFGALLKALHLLTDAVPFPAEPFEPLAKIHVRLDRLRREGNLPTGYIRVLETASERAVDLETQLKNGRIGSGLLHGDALIGNTLFSEGQLVLLDFDSVAYGAREWDLAPTFVTATRFHGKCDAWSNFVQGYGVETSMLAGIEAAGIVKQLSMTVALCLRSNRHS